MKGLMILVLLSVLFTFTACDNGGDSVTEIECKKNNDCLGTGEACNDGKCEPQFICTNTKSCYDNESEWDETTNPVVCDSGECKADERCKADTDCTNGMVCNLGVCEALADCSIIETVKITSLPTIITEGATKELKVVVLNKNGAELTTGETFTWNSTETDRVTVNNAVITGGTVSGVSDITVSVCEKTSMPLSVQNFAKVEEGKLRVIVMDVKGNKLEGASVKVLEELKTTSAEGFVLFDNTESLNSFIVSMPEYRSASFFEVSEKDIIVYLNEARIADSYTKAGGFKGQFDFDYEPIKSNGQVRFGLAGASLAGNILDMNFNLLLGEPIMTLVDLPGFYTGSHAIPSVIVAGFSDSSSINDTYKVTGEEGDRVFWGWGGKTSMADIAPIASAFMSGLDNIDIAKMLSQVMPIAKTFNHAIKPNQKIDFCDKVADVNDIDGDDNTTELIADFNSSCFPTVNMSLNQPLSLSSEIKFPTLPIMDGVQTEAAIGMISTVVEGKGMIPLGLTAGTDKKDNEDIADGKLDDVSLSYAPQHSGISNNDSMFVLVTMPLSSDALSGGSVKARLSGLINYYKNGIVEDNIDLSNETYLKLAEDAKVTDDVLTFTAIEEASLYMVNIVDNTGKQWILYSTKNAISLADKPEGFSTAYVVIVQAITLEDNKQAFSYNDLVKFNSSNLDSLNRLTSKFSTYELDDDKF